MVFFLPTQYTFSTSIFLILLVDLCSVLVLGQIITFILHSRTMPVSEFVTSLRMGHFNEYHLFNKAADVL